MEQRRLFGKMASFIKVISLLFTLLSVPKVLNAQRQDISVLPGQTVRADCNKNNRIPANINVAYSWEKPMGNVLSTDRILVIKDINTNNVGTYYCRAMAKDGATGMTKTETYTVNVKLRSTSGAQGSFPGSFNIALTPVPNSPPDTTILDPGTQYFQRCLVNQAQGVTVVWMKDGQMLERGDSFFLSSVQPSNAGLYVCTATNRNGQTISKSLRIQVRGSGGGGQVNPNPGQPGGYSVIVEATPTQPRINQPFKLTCVVNPQAGGVRYEWKVNGVVDQRQRSNVYDIGAFRKEDFRKKFECIAYIQGRPNSGERVVEVQFYDSTEIALIPPPGISVTIQLNSKRELHCETSNQRKPDGSRFIGSDVIWTFNGQRLNSRNDPVLMLNRVDRFLVSILTLNRITQANEGKYECELNGITKQAFLFTINNRPGVLTINPRVETVPVGDLSEFHCRLENFPNYKNTDVKWFFLGQRNDSGQNNRRPIDPSWTNMNDPNSAESSFISTRNVQPRLDGFYLCTLPSGIFSIGRLNVQRPASVSVSPKVQRRRPGASAEFLCVATPISSSTPIMWRFTDGSRVSNDRRVSVQAAGQGQSRLVISQLTMADNRRSVECYMGNARDQGVIELENPCDGPNTFRCDNGRDCIDRARRCDGKRDCPDGSDENPRYCRECDPLDAVCMIVGNRQPRNKRYSLSWNCDGEDDCGNGYDEQNCQYNGPQCGGTQYRCVGGGSNPPIIPMAFVCDNQKDCPNNDDEVNCRPPLINTSPSVPLRKTYRAGETITLTCSATGKPLPKVIWRYNWRCLPDKSRMIESYTVQNCDSVVSTLTIRSAIGGDSGIYNCEAISANKRVISPDYTVTFNRY